MTMTVHSAASPHALRAKRRRPQHAAALPAPATLPAVAAAPAAPKAAAAPAAPAIVKSPEYDPVDLAGVIGDVAGNPYGGVAYELVSPHVKHVVGSAINADLSPWFGTKYGAVVPGKLSGVITAEIGNLVGSVVADAARGALHGHVPGVEEGKPGLGYTPTPANKLLAKLIKGVATSWADMGLRSYLAPPPPPPAPVYPPDVQPLPPAPTPAPPAPKLVLGQPIGAVLTDAFTNGIYKTAISAVYDQTVGPFVQRFANMVTGRSDEPVKPASPLTPGKLANAFVDNVLGSLLVRTITYPTPTPLPLPVPPPDVVVPEPGFGGALGISILNNVIGAAWSTVYSRGLGTAIENGVNDLAGVRTKEEREKATLPALEHFTRAATRGVAVGATTYVLGNALMSTMASAGAAMGGVGGALISVAGAALIGALGGTAVDATVGPMLGRLGGQMYSWITGKPAYEQRMADAAKNPGPTPGDPVKAPNGNPGTVPAPSAPATPAPAPAAPAAGKPAKRRKTGNAAVDRTAPALSIPPARLGAIAARG